MEPLFNGEAESPMGLVFLNEIMYNKSCTFRDGVMVAQMILDHLVWVRALVPEPNGPMVKWLRRCPLKAESGVQFPLGLPNLVF